MAIKFAARTALVLSALLGTTAANAGTVMDYEDFEQMEYIPFAAGSDVGAAPHAVVFGNPAQTSSPHVGIGFEGISQYDVAAVARNFIPPDTMGAVGTTQYMNFANGGVAVYDKATGARTSFVSDLTFGRRLAALERMATRG